MGKIGGGALKRSTPVTLLSAQVFDNVTTTKNSSGVDCRGYREGLLHLDMLSTLTPTTIQFILQFSDDGGTTWRSHLQGPWASMFFEDTVMASQIYEAYSFPVVGKLFRLRAVAVGTSATLKFTVTAKVEFRN